MRRMAQIRAMKGLTQEALAALVPGLTQETVSRYENDRQKPFGESLVKIADALGCTIDELLRED
jgi:transcriptional regulator with XRE-family HTH domain